MLEAFPIRGAWRLDTRARRLMLALAVSLLVHALLYGTWVVAPVVRDIARKTLQRVAPSLARAIAPPPRSHAPPPQPREVAMVFVEVDPAAAAVAPPKETPFYSTHSTVAANPTPDNRAQVPKVDGKEQPVLRVMENPKPRPEPLQPTPPKPEPAPEPAPEPEPKTPPAPEPKPQPKPEPKIGDLAMLKTEPKVAPTRTPNNQTEPEARPRSRPRTLKEAIQRNPALAGQRTLQEGGVQRRARIAMIDAKGSPFGDYDYAFIRAVEQRWYQLLDNSQYQYLMDRQGKVVLTFRLHYDGRITDMQTDSNSVGDILGLLCQRAIMDPSPFARWPTAMRQAVQSDYREVKFSFYYD